MCMKTCAQYHCSLIVYFSFYILVHVVCTAYDSITKLYFFFILSFKVIFSWFCVLKSILSYCELINVPILS
jgi:hypothetical protein